MKKFRGQLSTLEETHNRRTEQYNLLETSASQLLADMKMWQDHLDMKAKVVYDHATRGEEKLWQEFRNHSVDAQQAALAAEEEMRKLAENRRKKIKTSKQLQPG